MIHPLNVTAQGLEAHVGSSAIASRQRYLRVALAVAAMLGLIPRIYVARVRRIEYDAFWDLFIAMQDRRQNFLDEVKAGSHPLLFHLIMRGVYHLGHSHLVYRMPGILATIGTAFLIGLIVKRISGSAVFAVLATLASTFAGVSIEMAVSMRPYPIAVFFVVLSFYYLLEVVELPEGSAAWKACAPCCLAICLAILTDYCSVFYLAALFGLLILRIAFDATWRTRAAEWLPRHPVPVIALLLLPLLVTFYLLVTHFGARATSSAFYWIPGRESLPGFLVRSLHLELNLLTPIKVGSRDAALLFIALSAALAAAVGFLSRKRDKHPALTWAPILMLLLLLLELSAAAAAGRYPFGGELRHQYILGPFLNISFFVLAAQITNLLRTPVLRAAFATALLIGIGVVSYRDWRTMPIARAELFAQDYRDFRDAVGHSDLICVDAYSLIGYFGLTNDWHWKFKGNYHTGIQPFILYMTTSPTGEQVLVLRNHFQWNSDLNDPVTYLIMAKELRLLGQTRMSLFHLAQVPDAMSWPEREASIERLADQQGLSVDKAFSLPGGMGAVFELK